MSSLDKIQAPIKQEMNDFEPYFKASLKNKVPLLDLITNYIYRRKGKQMRPMFVFLTAKLNGETCESSFRAATFIELLHTATLIHDDVVDEAFERRGFFSINALWKSKVAVLVGDFLLGKGMILAVEANEFDLLRIISNAVREMSEGELLQIEKSRKLDITEEVYYEVIRKKTATLIAACTASGASSVGASKEVVEKMRLFGEYVGMAFQIKDDLFDYQAKGLIGKPTGNDIKEKKITLPLIFALKQVSDSERWRILSLVKNNNKESKKIQKVIDFVHANDGLDYAREKMITYKNRAIELLNDYPDSEIKASLIEMVNYSIDRNK
jgi:octaprenyl-diphosphate synthase